MSNYKKTLFGLSIIVLLFICARVFFTTKTTYQNISSVAPQQTDYISDIKQVYWQGHMDAVVAVGNTAFTSFVLFDLQTACPFYVPNGVTYRDCMTAYIAKEQADFKGTKTQIQQSENYCLGISKQYVDGIEGTNLYQSCMAFKLSNKAN